MRGPPVMIDDAQVAGVVKAMGMGTVSVFSGIYAAITAAAGAEGNTVAIGTTLAVSVSFAGLILRMVIKNQAAIWDIVRSKDTELAKKDLAIQRLTLKEEYTAWEREQARFRANERTDPGPFTPSPELKFLLETDTTSSETS